MVRFILIGLIGLLSSACSFSIFPQLDLPIDSGDVDFVERATRENPKNAHAWFVYGKEKLKEGETAEARRAFQEARELDPNYTEALIGIGKTYLQDENWDRAEATFRSVLDQRPNSSNALEGLAEALYGDGALDEARSTSERLIERREDSFIGHLILGNIAYVFEDYDQALAHWKKASETGELPPDVLTVMVDLEDYVEKY